MKTKNRIWVQVFLFAALLIMLLLSRTIHTQAAGSVINKKQLVLLEGEVFRLKVKGIDSLKLSWRSSNEEIARVSIKGKVTALKRGTAVISARAKNGKVFTCSLRVAEKPLVAAAFLTTGEEPEYMTGMSVGLIGSRKARISKKMELVTKGQPKQTVYLFDVDKSIEKGKMVWKKSFLLKPATLENQNVVTEYFAKKDETEIRIGKKTKAVLYFVYDGIRMKITVPNKDLSGDTEVTYYKVTRAE